MLRRWAIAPLTAFLLCSLIACSGNKATVRDVQLQSDLETLCHLRVFFGHQSVGRNVLDGVTRISKETASTVRVIPTSVADAEGAWLAESPIGENGDPLGKCDAFRAGLERLRGNVDVALMKFCYVDFESQLSPDEIFQRYSQTIRNLKTRYPAV